MIENNETALKKFKTQKPRDVNLLKKSKKQNDIGKKEKRFQRKKKGRQMYYYE